MPGMTRKSQRDDARNELNGTGAVRHDMTVFQRMYAFLSQIFDYGNTADREALHLL